MYRLFMNFPYAFILLSPASAQTMHFLSTPHKTRQPVHWPFYLSQEFTYNWVFRFRSLPFSGHQYYVGVQYHPEYISRPMKPSPPYLGLLLAATGKMQAYRSRGYRMSPHLSYSEGNDGEEDEELAEIVRNLSTEDAKEAKDSSTSDES